MSAAPRIFWGLAVTVAVIVGAAECDGGGGDYETWEPVKITETFTPDPNTEYLPETEYESNEPAFSDEEIGSMSYALLLQAEYPGEFGNASEAALADLGRAICSDFDSGMDVFSIALSMDNFDPLAASYAVGAAGPAFCPENTEAMKEQFRTFAN